MAENRGKIRTRSELEDKIKEIFDIDTISLLISKQITMYVTEHKYTYLDIARALFYFFEVQNGDISKCKGIGIVPYVMNDAKKYFKELEAQTIQKELEAQRLKEKELSVVVCRNVPKRKVKNRMINIENIKEADDE